MQQRERQESARSRDGWVAIQLEKASKPPLLHGETEMLCKEAANAKIAQCKTDVAM